MTILTKKDVEKALGGWFSSFRDRDGRWKQRAIRVAEEKAAKNLQFVFRKFLSVFFCLQIKCLPLKIWLVLVIEWVFEILNSTSTKASIGPRLGNPQTHRETKVWFKMGSPLTQCGVPVGPNWIVHFHKARFNWVSPRQPTCSMG